MPQYVFQREARQTRYLVESLPGGVALEMVSVPAGQFMMGQSAAETEQLQRQLNEETYQKYYANELPYHAVTVPAFLMGRYPITQAQWRAVASLPPAERELKSNPSNFQGDTHPVEQVSWFDAIEFCARLAAHTGRNYRLPSEAEWEYACRAGTTTPYTYGPILTTDIANYNGNYSYNDSPKGEYRRETTPVDFFGVANAFGLCDMHGNVWEWCQDHFHNRYTGTPTDGSAWIDADATENKTRVLRGGSWGNDPRDCRAAYRFHFLPRDSNFDIGFRVVVSLPRALA